ncbi:microcystin degradation protein MlrC [bacterium DOLZORAL124_64_63]|nr:MAG: microcystin degradation protein MlrC [bacterium DOLZORAL124_64_63]
MRIGLAGISCECCTFSPWLSRAADFVELRGEDLLAEYGFLAEFPQVEAVPLQRARAIPGGSIEPVFYDRFERELLERLEQDGPWDGLFLHLHGAAHVQGRFDMEGSLLEKIRQLVGPDCLLAASYDLHGNVSARVATHLDVLSAYRLAPHRDWYETLERTWRLLVHCLENNIRPHLAFVPVPVLLPGEQTSTDFEPAHSLYARIPDLIDRHNLLDVSLLIGYVWADEPRAGGSVIALSEDWSDAEAAAGELAEHFWAARGEFEFGVPAGTADQCLEWAAACTDYPVIISDSGDNPTAGGVGDVPHMLERLLAAGTPRALVAGIADEAAVAACRAAGSGSAVDLRIGGKLDPIHGQPLSVQAQVLALHVVPFSVGTSQSIPQQAAVIRVDGVTVVLTQRRTPFHHLRDFHRLDLDPTEFPLLIVKMGYLVSELAEIAAHNFLALTPGAVSQDISSLGHRHLQRPLFPFDQNFTWQPSTG